MVVPQDIKDILLETPQMAVFNLSTNATLKTMLDSDDTLLKILTSGFSMYAKMSLVSNIKSAILELLNDNAEEKEFQSLLSGIAPMLLF